MAKKRMFNNEVLDTDAFLDMPLSAQALYFHLCMRADDDGFIGNPARIQKYVGASEDDLKLLVAKRFVLVFDDGVIVIKHWRMHNTIQKDRYKPTNYIDDLSMLGIKENRAYTLDDSSLDTKCFQNVSSLDTDWKQNVSPDIDIGLDIDIDLGLDKDIDLDNNIYINNKNNNSLSFSKENDCQKLSAKDFRRAVDLWNNLEDLGIKPVSRMTNDSQRYKRLKSRLREYGIEDYKKAIENIRQSDFLQGKSGSRPFYITFDWFVRPNNFVKVLDGNYNHSENGDGFDEWGL